MSLPAYDFSDIIREIKTNGGFKDYPRPLGNTNFSAFSIMFVNPRYPAHEAYGNGPQYIKDFGASIPQHVIDTQRHSFQDALHIFLPDRYIMSWMHAYFSGDFLHSPSLNTLLKRLEFRPTSRYYLDSEYTLELEAPERNRFDRKMFTEEEYDIAHTVSYKVPSIALSVLAYQASFMDYFGALGKAIDRSLALSAQERARGKSICNALQDNWKSKNFLRMIFTGVAVSYYKNHAPKIGEPPTQEDFMQGMSFVVENGAFRNHVTASDGQENDFTCPAKGVVVRTSAINPQTGKADKAPMHSMGVGLFHISRQIDSATKDHRYFEILKCLGVYFSPTERAKQTTR